MAKTNQKKSQTQSVSVLKPRHTTRIICSFEADLLNQNQQNFTKDVDGICIECSTKDLQKTLKYFCQVNDDKNHKDKSFSLSPANMVFIDDSEKFLICDDYFDISTELSTGVKIKVVMVPASKLKTINYKKIFDDLQLDINSSDDQLLFLKSSDDYQSLIDLEIQHSDLIKFLGSDLVFKISKSFCNKQYIVLDCEIIQGGLLTLSKQAILKQQKSFELKIAVSDILQAKINYLVVPGCASKNNISELRKLFPRDQQNSPWLIYLIDSMDAYYRFDQVFRDLDGVMIARRELAITAGAETVPMLTKELVNKCRDMAKLTMIASQMLSSMLTNVTPTRAEVSDIANSVYDGADAVVLASNVLKGPYGNQAIEVARKVIADVQSSNYPRTKELLAQNYILEEDIPMDVICRRAVVTAQRIQAKALVCITHTGNTALRLSSIETSLPIVALTFSHSCARKLSLLRGVQAMVLKSYPDFDQFLPRVNEFLKTTGWLYKNDKVVLITVTLSSMSEDLSNLFTIQMIY